MVIGEKKFRKRKKEIMSAPTTTTIGGAAGFREKVPLKISHNSKRRFPMNQEGGKRKANWEERRPFKKGGSLTPFQGIKKKCSTKIGKRKNKVEMKE